MLAARGTPGRFAIATKVPIATNPAKSGSQRVRETSPPGTTEMLAELVAERTGLTTVSLGSGPDADVMFLFQNDVCGEGPFRPRHARAYADLNALHAQIQSERVRALGAWRADVAAGAFPASGEVNETPPDELAAFLDDLD